MNPPATADTPVGSAAVFSECDPRPSFIIENAETEWWVLTSHNPGVLLSEIDRFEQLDSFVVPDDRNISEAWVDQCDADTDLHYLVEATVTSTISAVRAVDANENVIYIWGVYTEGQMVHSNDHGRISKEVGFFPALGQTESPNAAIAAADDVSAHLHAQVQPAPSCYEQCIQNEHDVYFQALKDCLLGCGIGVGAGANVCVLGCLGSGPGYPGCVASCVGVCGALGTGCVGGCVLAYTASMAGAAIGCQLGCWGI